MLARARVSAVRVLLDVGVPDGWPALFAGRGVDVAVLETGLGGRFDATTDFGRLAESIAEVEQAGADLLHLDVMDGAFCEDVSLPIAQVQPLRPKTDLPFDVHLMVERPERVIGDWLDLGVQRIAFHLEVCPEPGPVLERIREAGVSPLGGCLPMLIQIPFFIALYWVLLESVELRQAPWILWLDDLSIKDPFFVLPLIMGVSMFVQQKLNPPPPDPMQAKILMFLPVVFTVMFAFFPSGLVLYWVVNNLLSIAQQWVITKRIEEGAKA